MIWTFSSSFTSYVLVCSLSLTFLSKLNSSTYLSEAFQLNNGCLKSHLQYFGLCASPTLAGLAPNRGLGFASFSTITTTFAVWIATSMIAVWIESDSAISVCILYESLLIYCNTYVYLIKTSHLIP